MRYEEKLNKLKELYDNMQLGIFEMHHICLDYEEDEATRLYEKMDVMYNDIHICYIDCFDIVNEVWADELTVEKIWDAIRPYLSEV